MIADCATLRTEGKSTRPNEQERLSALDNRPLPYRVSVDIAKLAIIANIRAVFALHKANSIEFEQLPQLATVLHRIVTQIDL